jgi:CheY-like chemotaxis protein
VGRGTGLGLSIARQLVQQMGGDIFVDSAPGEGARFSIFFERRAVEALPAAEEVAAPPSHEQLRVLVVDDDLLFLRALERTLSREFEVKVAPGAAEAIEILGSDGDFDAVVLDVIMPAVDGTQLYTRLAEQHAPLAARTCFLTGGVTSPHLRQAVEASGRPCLAKPLDDRELARTVRALARPEAARGESRPLPALNVVR